MTSLSVETLREERRESESLPRMELDQWWREFGVVAGITTSERDFDLANERSAEPAREIWRAIDAGFEGRFSCAALSRQAHGTRVQVVSRPAEGLLLSRGLDGHVTASRGVLLGVTTADCVPVYLLHQKSGTIGLVHAGWRGTRDGVLMAAVRKVCRIAGEGPWDLVMHCGVSICGSCYEVGPEVLSMFGGDAERGPGKLDLRAVLAGQAQALGIERVTVSSWCTLHHEGSFHSHRGSGAGGGRMLAYLGRPRA